MRSMRSQLSVIFLLTALLQFLGVQSQRSCDPGYTNPSSIPGNSYCYRYVAQSMTWANARAFCVGDGGDLVSIASTVEDDFVFALCGQTNKNCWIGLTDSVVEGTFAWSDGRSYSSSQIQWTAGQPDNGGGTNEDCASTYQAADSSHERDLSCSPSGITVHFVCMKRAGCPPGQLLSGGSCSACPTGTYASVVNPNSYCSSCPAGRYGSTQSLTTSDCTGACATGYFCPAASTSSTQTQCPAGRYGSSTGMGTSDCSGPCAASYFCTAGGNTATPSANRCNAGRYGDLGQTVATCSGPCSAGYYCPVGSASPTQTACGGSQYYCPVGSSTTTTVTTGYYTRPENGTTRSSQSLCDPGYYCLTGNRIKCPSGRYGSLTGETRTTCEGNCNNGYFCNNGSTSAYGVECGSGIVPPESVYCPAGVTSRQVVPSGFYSSPLNVPNDQRYSITACPSNSVCTNGIRVRKIFFSNTCTSVVGGNDNAFTGSTSINENTFPNTVSTIPVNFYYGTTSTVTATVTSPSGCNRASQVSTSYNAGITTLTVSTSSPGADYETCPTYSVAISASQSGYTATCTLTVTINDRNDAPAPRVSSYNMLVPELSPNNTLVGNPVETETPVEVDDEDRGQEVVFRITAGNSAGFFDIGSCSGQIFVANPNLNYEVMPRNPHYTLTVTATDNGVPPLSSTVTVYVTVVNVNEPPYFNQTQYNFVIPENSPAGTRPSPIGPGVIDPDEGQTLTFSIINREGDGYSASPPFLINAQTGIITVGPGILLNYELKTSIDVTIIVQDSGTPTYTRTLDATITILNRNDPPVCPTIVYSVDENTGSGVNIGVPFTCTDEDVGSTITYAITSGMYSGNFSAATVPTNSAQLSTSGTPTLNYEVTPMYTFILGATDNGIPGFSPTTTSMTITINLNNVNEAPIITPGQVFSVLETASIGTFFSVIQVRDPDAGQSMYSSLLSNGFGAFTIDNVPRLRTSAVLNFENISVYTINIRVDDNGSPPLFTTGSVTVNVLDRNEVPTILAQTVWLPENSVASTAATWKVNASDADAADQGALVFSISGADNTYMGRTMFTIDASGASAGTIRVSNAALVTDIWASDLDYERKSVYSLTVQVTDTGCCGGPVRSATATITLRLTNVKEAPRIVYQYRSVNENNPPYTFLDTGPVLGIDQDSGQTATLTFSLTSDPSGRYAIFPNGTAYLIVTSPDLTVGDDRTNVTIRVTDADALFTDNVVTFIVSVFNTPPVFTPPIMSFNFNENNMNLPSTIATLTATDPDVPSSQTLSFFINTWTPTSAQSLIALSPSGVLQAIGTLDFETLNSIVLTVTVQDNGPGFKSGLGVITISVVDLNEAPVVQAGTLYVYEEVANGYEVGKVNATDQDIGAVIGYSMTATGSSINPLPFSINSATGYISVSSRIDYDPPNGKGFYYLLITATDGLLSSSNNVTINVMDINESPMISPATFTVSESQPAGTLMNENNGRVTASDPDSPAVGHGRYFFTILSGDPLGQFQIDPITGTISTTTYPLDFEDRSTYSLVISITDTPEFMQFLPPLIASATMTINVLNVNDVSITSVFGSLMHATAGGEFVYFNGTNFGPTADNINIRGASPMTVSATYGPNGVEYTASGCIITMRNTQVRCTTVPGIGELTWILKVVELNDMITSAPKVTAYLGPSVTSIDNVMAIPSAGGSSIVIHGMNFGPISNPLIGFPVSYASASDPFFPYFPMNCQITQAHTEVTCISVEGCGNSLSWLLTVGGQVSVSFTTGSYAMANITDIRGYSMNGELAFFFDNPMSMSTTDQLVVALVGTNFPPSFCLNVMGEYGAGMNPDIAFLRYMSPTCMPSVSLAEVVCSIEVGMGRNHSWRLTIGNVPSYLSTVYTSYAPPVITVVEGSGAFESLTDGGQLIVLRGFRFGPMSPDPIFGPVDPTFLPNLYYGKTGGDVYDGMNCRVTSSDSEISCLSAPGTGAMFNWKIMIGEQWSNNLYLPESGHHNPVVVQYVSSPGLTSPPDGNTRGNDSVYIEGRNFGMSKMKIDSIRYGKNETMLEYAGVNCDIFTPHTVLRCYTQEGAGAGLLWKIIIDGLESEAPSTNYGIPTITSFSGPASTNAITEGNQLINIHGTNFGPDTSSGMLPKFIERITYGPSGREYMAKLCNITVAHTQISCFTSAGSGSNLKWVVVVEGQYNSMSPIWSYAMPELWNLTVVSGSTNGGYLVTATGTNMGIADPQTRIKINFHGIIVNSVNARFLGMDQSLSQVDFFVPEFYGLNRTVKIQTQTQSSIFYSYGTTLLSNHVLFNFDEPFIDFAVVRDSSDREYNTSTIIIAGSSFGSSVASGKVMFRDSVAGIRNVTWSHDLISFVHYYFSGEVSVFVNDGLGSIPIGYLESNDYMVDGTNPEFPTSARDDFRNNIILNTIGGETVTFEITNLGIAINATEVTFGEANILLTPVGVVPEVWAYPQNRDNRCRVIGDAATQLSTNLYEISCITPPGMGIGNRLEVLYFSRPSAAQGSSSIYVRYKGPVISDVISLSAGTTIAKPAANMYIIYAPTEGGNVRIVGDNFGLNGAVNYSTPEFNNPTFGTLYSHTVAEFTIRAGIMFASPMVDPPVVPNLVNAIEYPVIFYSGYPANDYIQAQSLQSASANIQVRYLPPTANVGQVFTSDTRGMGDIIITGSNFGDVVLRPYPKILIGGRECMLKLLANGKRVGTDPHHSITCTVPQGVGANNIVSIQVGMQTVIISNAGNGALRFSYNIPLVYYITPNGGMTSGKDIITIVGNNFGTDKNVVSIQFRPPASNTLQIPAVSVPISSIQFINHTHLIFELPEGYGNNFLVSVTVGGQGNDLNLAPTFSYNPPVITSLIGANGVCRTRGEDNCILTIRGLNFGPPLDVEPVFLGYPTDRQCVRKLNGTAKMHNHFEISCIIPPGWGNQVPVTVNIAGQVSAASAFRYASPILQSATPDFFDALGSIALSSLVTFYGDNFGPEGSNNPVLAWINGRECVNASIIIPHQAIGCVIQNDTVGFKQVTVYAANQTSSSTPGDELLTLYCEAGYYGQVNENCLYCPLGGCCGEKCDLRENITIGSLNCTKGRNERCTEYLEPYSQVGFYRKYLPTPDDLCPTTRQNRSGLFTGSCAFFVACEPPEACLGNNLCATGYKPGSERCSLCDKRYYRFDGECVKCPDQSWLLITLFILFIICACASGYYLNKKKVNLAFVSIGVDYFQVISIFSRSKVAWPPFLKRLLTLLSVFNLNIDLAAPECAIPDVGYKAKWTAVMLLPVTIAGMLLLFHIMKYLNKRCILRVDSQKRNSHLPQLVGTFLIMLYYLYLYVTRTVFDVFNCSPVDPPDGHEYLQVVFEDCATPGGIHESLYPWAIVFLLIFVLGYPAGVVTVLWRNKDTVKIDQLLRAQGLGETRASSIDFVYQFRKLFHKLYYHFKPGKWYWILFIIGRKFGIAVTSLLFRRTPGFQLAMALLVLFAAFALQVKHVPYMSTSERIATLLYHEQKVLESDKRHMKLDVSVKEVKAKIAKGATKATMEGLKEKLKDQKLQGPTVAVWDYNTVEATLLFSSCLVCLSGIMFESNRFDNESYSGTRDGLGVLVVLIIVFSMLYFTVVFVTEVLESTCPSKLDRCKKLQGSHKKSAIELEAERRAKKGVASTSALESGSQFQYNPLAGTKVGRDGAETQIAEEESKAANESLKSTAPPDINRWIMVKKLLGSMQDEIATLNSESKALKKTMSMAAASITTTAAAASGRKALASTAAVSGTTVKAKKKAFGPVDAAGRSDMSAVTEGLAAPKGVRPMGSARSLLLKGKGAKKFEEG